MLQLEQELPGGRLVGTAFYKKQRAAYFYFKCEKARRALGFVYHPGGYGCFCVPVSKVRIDSREKPWPVFSLGDAEVVSVRQLGLDRFFELTINDGQIKRLLFEAIGPNGNIWLLDENGLRQATLRKRQFVPGEPYVPADPGERIDPRTVSPDQLVDLLENRWSMSLVRLLAKNTQGFDEVMARESVRRAGIEDAPDCDLSDDEIAWLAASIRETASRFTATAAGYLYDIGGGSAVYPFKLGSVAVAPEKYKSLSLAVLAAVDLRQFRMDEAEEEKRIMQAVDRAVKRLQKRIANIEKDIDEASDYESCRRYAELLQLNRHLLRRGMEQVEVRDVFSDPVRTVAIRLEKALSPNENIGNYFKRYRKGREGLELMQRRLEISTEEWQSVQRMQEELSDDFTNAAKRYRAELTSLLPVEANRKSPQVRLPYREAKLSTGLTVFIGRDGADNDRTTFEFARPYELWFHTQQCPGSHVVMKFPNKSFVPSKKEIEEAAAIAAYHSRARRDSLVPVIYSQRKHVRKPRKAKPGLVTVEREKSVMVAPRKPVE